MGLVLPTSQRISSKMYVAPVPTQSWAFLICLFVIQGVVKIMSHAIFGVNGAYPKDTLNLNLNPPSAFARRHPLYTHPSQAVSVPLSHVFKFHPRVKWTQEQQILAKNGIDHPNRTKSTTVGGGGLEWGAWFEFSGDDERITTPSLAFLVDIFTNSPGLLPKSERPGLKTRYFNLFHYSLHIIIVRPFFPL